VRRDAVRTGNRARLSKLTFREVAIDNCTTGLKAVSGTYTLEDVSVLDTTAGVDPGVVATQLQVQDADRPLALDSAVPGRQTNGVLNVTNSTLSFRLSKGAPTGVIVESKGALGMVDCTVDSPVSRLLVFRLMRLRVRAEASTSRASARPPRPRRQRALHRGGGLISGIVVQDARPASSPQTQAASST